MDAGGRQTVLTGARSTPPPAPATRADLEKLPENVVGEILGGVLDTEPRPAYAHARAGSRAGMELARAGLRMRGPFPSTERKDRSRKMPIDARERVPYVWLVNRNAKTLEAYRCAGERYLLLGTWADDARVRIEPFDAIELDLSVLWEE